MDSFLIQCYSNETTWPILSVGPKHELTLAMGEVILASKLSAMATRPIYDDWIPVSCVSFDAATAADTLNRNTSSYEQQIPCTRFFLPRVTPSPI